MGGGSMSQGTKFAIALVLLWLAGIGLFVAFHPGGLKDPGLKSKDNPDGAVENPADLIQYYIRLIGKK
jgi:hypothetical protein